MEDELQVVVVDDHPAMAQGIERILMRAGMRITGTAATVEDAIATILARLPHVVLLDIALGADDGLAVPRAVLAEAPTVAFLVYTGLADHATLQRALAAGARGLASKVAPPNELVSAVRAVARGDRYVDPWLAQRVRRKTAPALTRREREVLDLLAAGLTGDQIAARLYISPQTVYTHIRNAMAKLGANTRAHALALALARHEIGPGALRTSSG